MPVDRMPFGALLLLLTTLLSSVLFADSVFDISKRRLQIRKLAMCKGQESLPIRWSNVSVNYNEETKETLFGLKMEVLREVSNNFSMAFNFWKCDASGNPDSCEYVIKNYVNKEICKFMGAKNQGWSIFIEYLDRPLVCPIKTGVYNLVNCPVKADFLRKLPIGDAVWKVKFWGYDLDVTLSCVDMEIQLTSSIGGRRG